MKMARGIHTGNKEQHLHPDMQIYLLGTILLVLAISCRGDPDENIPCTEAQTNYNSCTDEKGYNNCWDLYYQVLGACYSKAWQECAETEHEYFGKGCDRVGEEKDESCDELKEKIGSICTNEWFAGLYETTGATRDVEK
ncbi:unnamed protein product [Lymnaea stagnalis]|uniref:Lipoprotein n=1 Tax=Lymnaea stagnalis TaxID=6523 RepID=A0AAV2H679_LYMST